MSIYIYRVQIINVHTIISLYLGMTAGAASHPAPLGPEEPLDLAAKVTAAGPKARRQDDVCRSQDRACDLSC